jgi:hypothetical protein
MRPALAPFCWLLYEKVGAVLSFEQGKCDDAISSKLKLTHGSNPDAPMSRRVRVGTADQAKTSQHFSEALKADNWTATAPFSHHQSELQRR